MLLSSDSRGLSFHVGHSVHCATSDLPSVLQMMHSNRQRPFSGMKVFSATMQRDRDRLGERVTDWLAGNASLVVVDVVVTQSSDNAFHCVSITLFYSERS